MEVKFNPERLQLFFYKVRNFAKKGHTMYVIPLRKLTNIDIQKFIFLKKNPGWGRFKSFLAQKIHRKKPIWVEIVEILF